MMKDSQENNLPEWRISQLKNGRWVIERLRRDASKPYYLTQRIYRFRATAEREFAGVVIEITMQEHMKEEARIQELIKTTVPTLRERWPKELEKYSDRVVAAMFNDFYFSMDAGDNDSRFPAWFDLLPDYRQEIEGRK